LQASRNAEEQEHSDRHSIPQAVLAETAVLDFLQRRSGNAPANKRPPEA
jgi:hypothetical protein